ncbi:histidine phosphatase superfamily [Russula dissimulans]|nr:histidine phosphatase superfamily [Russula dissimulans]
MGAFSKGLHTHPAPKMAGAPQPGFPLCPPMTAGYKPSNPDHARGKGGGIREWGAESAGSAEVVSDAVPGAVARVGRVLFVGRRGEGSHNAAIAQYGQRAWDEYALEGMVKAPIQRCDSPIRSESKRELVKACYIILNDIDSHGMTDPRLTPLGEQQARDAHAAWRREIDHGVPVPQTFYCGPLSRALRTLELTFEGVLPTDLKPIILENCREHCCDKCATRQAIASEFPKFVFEEGFEEEDDLFTADRETEEHLQGRAKLVLDRTFQNKDDTYVSVTAHAGWIRGFFYTIGREIYELPTGGTY